MADDPNGVRGPSPVREATASSSPRRSAEALLAAAPEEQIASAVAAEKWARAADLLALNGERLLLDGQHDALVGWLDALPDEHVARSARLGTLYAWVLVYAQRYQEALARLAQAERTLQVEELAEAAARRRGDVTSDELELRPHAELKQSMHAVRAHLASLAADPAKLPDTVEEIMLPASADHPTWRACALLTLGRCRVMAGDLAGARADLEAARLVAGQARGPRAGRTAAEAAVLLGRVAEARGALTEAARLYAEVLAHPVDPGVAAAAAAGLASVALWRSDLPAARQALERQVPPDADPIAVGLDGGLVRAYLAALGGQHEEARALADALERDLHSRRIRWPHDLLQAHKARLALLRGDDSTAKRWLQGVSLAKAGEAATASLAKAGEVGTPVAALQIATKALALLRIDPRAALTAAAHALAFAEATGHRLMGLEALVVTGLASHAVGLRDDARSALRQALDGAAAEGIARPFLLRTFDAVAEDLGLEGPFVLALRAAARALPQPATAARERPLTPRPGAGGLIETRHAPATPEPAADAQPATEAQPAPDAATDAEPAI